MKISPPNYTQTPNVFFDEVFKTLTEGELRIVLVLVRQTFGWHKNVDRISLGQLAKKTGMIKTSICRSLNSLLNKNLIQKHKFGTPGKERCYYALVMEKEKEEMPLPEDDGIESEEERAIISNNFDQSPKETPPVSQRDYPQSPKETHKINSSKETIQKKQQQQVSTGPTPVSKVPSSAAVFSSSQNQKQKQQVKETRQEAPKEKSIPPVPPQIPKSPPPVKTPPSKNKVYSCLNSINLQESEKFHLTEHYPEDRVIEVVDVAKSKKTPPKSLMGFLIWALDNGIKPLPPIEDTIEENKRHAEALESKLEAPPGFRLECLSKHAEIVFTTCSKDPIILDYSSTEFKIQIDNNLRKFGFKEKK